MVILLKREDGLTLNLYLPAEQESVKEAIRRIFENPEFGQNIGGMEHVSVALNSAGDAVAGMMVDSLVEGFGVMEEEQLMFISYKSADRLKAG